MLVDLVEMVSSVSRALDLVHSDVTDHHRRVTTIAVAIAESIGLAPRRRADLAIAGSLHDVGVVSERARLALLGFGFREGDPGDDAAGGELRCHADHGHRLLSGFAPFASAAAIIRHHHLFWAHGAGARASGGPVPLESHVVHLADRVAVLLSTACPVLEQRDAVVRRIRGASGEMFVPELVEAFADASAPEAFWLEIVEGSGEALRRSVSGDLQVLLDTEQLLALAGVFARLIDFRSPFTASHSAEVGRVAERLAARLGMPAAKHKPMHIAGLLHDLGKLGVPPAVLDKPGPLTPEEVSVVRAHPYYTHQVLRGVACLDEIRAWAAHHHERVDGRGYPFRARSLDLGSRIVAVADVYAALVEDRPYRPALSRARISALLEDAVASGALDGDVVSALLHEIGEVAPKQSGTRPAVGGRLLRAVRTG